MKMTGGFREILKDGDVRRPAYLCSAALIVWVLSIALTLSSDASLSLVGMDLSSSGRVLDYAMQLKALPRAGNVVTDIPEEPLSALSDIINALGLRDRMQQLQSNPSGIVVQLERLYGSELGELLGSIENNGMSVKTAEIRALPGDEGKVLNAVLTMEPAK
jgi:hypothetical protein